MKFMAIWLILIGGIIFSSYIYYKLNTSLFYVCGKLSPIFQYLDQERA